MGIEKKVGDLIDVKAWDHTTVDYEGWKPAGVGPEDTPATIHVRGFYVGETDLFVKVCFAKCEDDYSTAFLVLKSAIIEVQ